MLILLQGGGHFVPLDRAEAALQMINNFINHLSYSEPAPFSGKLTPLKPQYQELEKVREHNALFYMKILIFIKYLDNWTERVHSSFSDCPSSYYYCDTWKTAHIDRET